MIKLTVYRFTKEFLKLLKPEKNYDQISRKDATHQLMHNNRLKNVYIRTIKNYKQKMEALFFKDRIKMEAGFRIINSHGFNSFGFKEEVDLVFCDKRHQVIETYSNFRVNKMTRYVEGTYSIYVLAPNSNKYLNIKNNDILKLYR